MTTSFLDIGKASSPRFEIVDKKVYERIIDALMSRNKFLESMVRSDTMGRIINDIKENYKKIGEIINVYAKFGINSVDVIAIVGGMSKEVQRKVYSIEYELLNRFKEYMFEFILVSESIPLILPNYYRQIL